MNRFIFSIIVLLLVQTTPRTPAAATDTINSATLSLSVRDCLLMALENNRSLAVERYGPEIFETFTAEEQSIFDPMLNVNLNATDTRGQRTSGVAGFREVESKSNRTDITLSKKFPLGLAVDAELSSERRSSNVYNKLYSTRIGATLMMPVLEGFGQDVNLAGVKQAESDIEISKYELQGFVNALALQVESIYWDIQLAREELTIQNASLDLARRQFAETKDRIDVGALGEIESAAAEGEVALRESAVIDAHSALQKKNLELLHALNPPSENRWSLAIELLDLPAMDDGEELGSIEQRTSVALSQRPDMLQARLSVERNEIEIVRTKNGLLPKLDFFITFGRTGYSSSFGDSVKSIVDDENYDAAGGLIFQMPIGNHADRARHKRAQLSVKEAESALANFEQLVELDVRNAYIEVARATQQIDVTRRAAQLQEAKHQAELEKFKVGKSTNLLVLVAQRDLIQARIDEVRASIERRKALSSLHYMEGTILDRQGIVLPKNK